jgi:hypothetical protein
MRWTVIILLTVSLSVLASAQETTEDSSPQPRHQLPGATAEPDNAHGYAPPQAVEGEGPSAADRGPAQRPFTLATETDTLADGDNPPTIENLPVDKQALDRRIRIAKIHDVENDSTYKFADNQALQFEIKYINWGAVTAEQLQARHGHYFTISWTNHGPVADFTARFQYREVKSKEIVRTLVEPMPHVRGTVRSYFGVVGKAYKAYGPVASWRFSILKGDTVVAETKSYIW